MAGGSDIFRALMQFDSFTFLLFFALVLLGAALCRSWSARKTFLLIASYLFYAGWSPLFTLLLAASSIVDWLLARNISRADEPTRRRFWLVVSLIMNLGLLSLFKYGQFLHDNLAALLAPIGIELAPWQLGLVLPVGISFYTFQSISYTIDVYRRRVEPIRSLRDFCLFVAFFPQLVAGPIVRFEMFAPQLQTPRVMSADAMATGMLWLLWGLFEKIVLADSLFAPVADLAWANPAADWASLSAIGALAFAGQIFCDFAGYSCCAIGVARCLGFQLPINFNNPYAAAGFSDFWRRWHISLSTWLRDYLYVGLGGNRGSRARNYRNLMLTMLLGGLWHGAGWNFVLWGGLHGTLLVIERLVREKFGVDAAQSRGVSRVLWTLVTLTCVVLLWIPFRAPDLASTGVYLGSLLGDWSAPTFHMCAALIGFVLLVAVQWIARERLLDAWIEATPSILLPAFMALLLVMIVLSPGDNHAFIYFQF